MRRVLGHEKLEQTRDWLGGDRAAGTRRLPDVRGRLPRTRVVPIYELQSHAFRGGG